MNDVYAVIGVRWTEKDGRWKLRKKTECVSEDRMTALQIAEYLNNTQTRYEFSVDAIPNYDSMNDFLYYEV
jgi:hypothetical protein